MASAGQLSVARPAAPDFAQVTADAVDNRRPIRSIEPLAEFLERVMHDVVVVQFLGRHLAAQLEPDPVQQVDLLRREVRRVRAQIEDVLLAGVEVAGERQVRLGIRQPLPDQS